MSEEKKEEKKPREQYLVVVDDGIHSISVYQDLPKIGYQQVWVERYSLNWELRLRIKAAHRFVERQKRQQQRERIFRRMTAQTEIELGLEWPGPGMGRFK